MGQLERGKRMAGGAGVTVSRVLHLIPYTKLAAVRFTCLEKFLGFRTCPSESLLIT